jgi:sugar/nucleoside kinase (ribokinase family)
VTELRYDILGIGNAMVDVVARVDDSFLSRHDMHKGAMILIDAAAA